MTDRTNKEILVALEVKVENLAQSQTQLNKLILGNNREGLLERLTRAEENLTDASATVKNLSQIVQAHVTDDKHNSPVDRKLVGGVLGLAVILAEGIHQLIQFITK